MTESYTFGVSHAVNKVGGTCLFFIISLCAYKVWHLQQAQLCITSISQNVIPNLYKGFTVSCVIWRATCLTSFPFFAPFHLHWLLHCRPCLKYSGILMAQYLVHSDFCLDFTHQRCQQARPSTPTFLTGIYSLPLLYFPLCTHCSNMLYILQVFFFFNFLFPSCKNVQEQGHCLPQGFIRVQYNSWSRVNI